MNLSFLEQPRQVSFDWHIVQVKKWLDYDSERELDSVLVYASIELRIAIERYIFELLCLLKEQELSKEDELKCRSINGLFELMKETDPYYRKTIEFTKIVASLFSSSGGPEITVVDTAYLRRKWQELSEYCHKQLYPNKTFGSYNREFQERGFALIREVFEKFHEWKFESVCGVLRRSSMPEEVKSVYDKFVNGHLGSDQVRRILSIMEPVLQTRSLWK